MGAKSTRDAAGSLNANNGALSTVFRSWALSRRAIHANKELEQSDQAPLERPRGSKLCLDAFFRCARRPAE